MMLRAVLKSTCMCAAVGWTLHVAAAPPPAAAEPGTTRAELPKCQTPNARHGTPPGHDRSRPRVMPAHVYLLRGLMNVFSLGMDDLAAKIAERRIEATVRNHSDEDAIGSEILARYRSGDMGPVILIGHSLGADAAMFISQALDRQSIPVALAILFDATRDHIVPKNVGCAVNFTQRFYLRPGPNSRATIANVDLSNDNNIDHLTIDKSPSLQNDALNYVLQAAASSERP